MDHLSFQNVKIPALGFGTWKLAGEGCVKSVGQALSLGYRHIDTAQIYGNEEDVGQAIAESAVPRGQVFLTTKVWMDNVGERKLAPSVEESLHKLRTDHVDLLLIHWPVEQVPFDEQLRALQDVQKAGKARLIGVSNFTVAQMTEVTKEIGAVIATDQVEYHPFLDQSPVLDFCRANGMFLTAYSPLARGKILGDRTLEEIAETHGKTVGQVTLRWLVQQGDVAAIPKAGSEKHLKENFAIFDFALSAAEMARIGGLAHAEGRLINPEWSPAWDRAP